MQTTPSRPLDHGGSGARTRERRSRRFARHPGRRHSSTELGLGLAITEAPVRAKTALREGLYRRLLALSDVLVAGIVLAGVFALAGIPPLQPELFLGVPVIVLANKLAGLYDRDDLVLAKNTLDEAPALLQVSGLFALIAWLAHAASSPVTLRPLHVLVLWGGLVILLMAGRTLARVTARHLSARERCLLVGDPQALATVAKKLEASRHKAEVVATLPLELRSLGADEFRRRIAADDIQRVIIAPITTGADETLDLIRIAKAAGVRVSVLPRLLEVVGSAVAFDQLEGLVMLGVRSFGLSRSSRALKRIFDIAGAGSILLVLSPLMLVIAAAIRLESGGPVFFRQTRVGRDGRRFGINKFRSMVVDAEQRKQELLHLNEASGLFKIAADPRITRVGRVLRATSLDELPQLLNVLNGDMSLVGPRPLVVDEDARVLGLDRSRLALTPGMTGHWQILGSSRIPMEEMVGIDYLYVANWSLWTDLKILLRTVPYVLSRRGM